MGRRLPLPLREGGGGGGGAGGTHRPTSPPTPSLKGLRDSQNSPEGPAVHDGPELKEPPQGHDRPGLAIIASPPTETGAHPCGVSQGSLRMRVLLPVGVAFGAGARRLDCWPVLRSET